MLVLDRAALASVRAWFTPERPGPMIFEQVVRSGVGSCRVDRWPQPRVVLAELPGGNVALRGDPDALPTDALDGVAGFVDAPPDWLPALRSADPDVGTWARVISVLPPEVAVARAAAPLLGPADAAALAAFEPDGAWIHDGWGGADALAAAGVARGIYTGERLVSVATPFYTGARYEDIGVVTDSRHRRRGLSTACAAAVVADIRDRGRIPSWSTSPDNAGSRGVAANLGFVEARTDVLYALRAPVPGPA